MRLICCFNPAFKDKKKKTRNIFLQLPPPIQALLDTLSPASVTQETPGTPENTTANTTQASQDWDSNPGPSHGKTATPAQRSITSIQLQPDFENHEQCFVCLQKMQCSDMSWWSSEGGLRAGHLLYRKLKKVFLNLNVAALYSLSRVTCRLLPWQ